MCLFDVSFIDCLLVLDGVEVPEELQELSGNVAHDPGNLGTLIRSARAFNWDGIFLLPPCCDPFNEKVLCAACGASLQPPIVSCTRHDLLALMTKCNIKIMAGHPQISSDGTKVTHPLSKELSDSLVNEYLCLVLGSEGNGLSAETHQT